ASPLFCFNSRSCRAFRKLSTNAATPSKRATPANASFSHGAGVRSADGSGPVVSVAPPPASRFAAGICSVLTCPSPSHTTTPAPRRSRTPPPHTPPAAKKRNPPRLAQTPFRQQLVIGREHFDFGVARSFAGLEPALHLDFAHNFRPGLRLEAVSLCRAGDEQE